MKFVLSGLQFKQSESRISSAKLVQPIDEEGKCGWQRGCKVDK